MEFAEPKKLQDGRYFVKATGVNKFQLNNCNAPAGFQTYILTKDSVEKVKNLETMILQAALENSKSWFGQEVPEKKIEKAFDSPLDGNILEVPLYKLRGEVLTKFWSSDRTDKDMDSEWDKIDIIVEVLGLKIAKKNFEPVMRILQVKDSAPSKVQEYMFVDDDDLSDILN